MKKPAQPEPRVQVKILRAFYYGGEARAIGEKISMSLVDYKQWQASNKVKLIEPDPDPASVSREEPVPEAQPQKKEARKNVRS